MAGIPKYSYKSAPVELPDPQIERQTLSYYY